jgi:Fe-S-cluster containining protein
MAKDKDGWCVALDKLQMKCSIYASRPITCRSFVMAGPYCRAQREEHVSQSVRAIEIEII